MGKYDHINELTGAENYFQWRRQMMLALQGEHLWPHCSDGTDEKDLANLASSIPTPTDPSAITKSERESILDWLAKDAQAKALIDRKISITIAALLDVSHCHIPYDRPSQLRQYSPLPTPLETNSGMFSPRTCFRTSGHVLGSPLVILHFSYLLLY